MRTMTPEEMEGLHGEGFLGGLSCGFAIIGALVLMTSPDPFSKFALLGYGGGVASCVSAYR